MSSYIVTHVTINRILSFIQRQKQRGGAGWSSVPDDLTKFGQKLLAMNVKAVSQRYPHDKDNSRPGLSEKASANQHVESYVFRSIGNITGVQAWKSAHCLEYQCSEGTVPKMKLFKLLNILIANISYTVIDKLPEAVEAEWG